MVHTRIHRRLSTLLAMGLVMGAGLILASPAEAQQDRYRVLVPNLQGDGPRNFGRNVAREVQKLIDEMRTHRAVERGEFRSALREYDMKEKDLTCVSSQQLATVADFELVMCGEYEPSEGSTEVTAQFVSPREQITFDVPAITTQDTKEAARHIFDSFERYVQLISYTQYCNQDLANEQWDEALRRCDQALEIEPNTLGAHYGRGFALMKLERFDESLDALKMVLDADPYHSEGLMAAGFVAASLDRTDESREYYNQYLELNPGDAQVRLKIAIEAAGAGDPAGALQIAEDGLDGEEDDVTLMEYAGYFAMSAGGRADRDSAAKSNDQDAGASPEAAALYEKALGYFEPVLEERGDEAATNLIVQMLNAYNNLGRTDDAVEFGAQAIELKADEPQVWNTYANVLSDADRVEEALAALDTVLALNPEASRIRDRQGRLLLRIEELERAQEAFAEAIERGEIDPNAAATNFLAVGFNEKFQKELYDDALEYFEIVRDFAEDPRIVGQANYFSGFILLNRGMAIQEPRTEESARESLPIFQEAKRYFEESREFDSGNLDEFLDNAERFIEIQEALIQRAGG